MAGSSAVLSDDSALSRIDRGIYRIEKVFGVIAGATVLILMLLAVVSVGGRNLFNAPLPGYVDWIQVLMPLIAFLGISYAQRDGGHIRMDILIGRLQGRALWTAEFVTTLVTLGLILLLVWGSWAHFDRSFDFSRPLWSRDSTIDIGLPVWPSKILVPVAFSVLCLRLLIQIWAYGRAFVLGLERPVAVPLIQSVAEQAASEADQLEGRD